MGTFSFVWVVIGCGVISASFIVMNLFFYGLHRYPADPRHYVKQASGARGREALERYGCGGCHFIPGVRNATGRVGPKLDGIDQQTYIAGQLPNTPENLVSWIRNPQTHAPGTAMPALGVTEQEARDMAAYLYAYRP